MRQAATEIGLKVKIDSVSAANYINFFTDARGAQGHRHVLRPSNYPDYADPAGLYNTFAVPGGTQNYDNFSDPEITNPGERARSTANPTSARRWSPRRAT